MSTIELVHTDRRWEDVPMEVPLIRPIEPIAGRATRHDLRWAERHQAWAQLTSGFHAANIPEGFVRHAQMWSAQTPSASLRMKV